MKRLLGVCAMTSMVLLVVPGRAEPRRAPAYDPELRPGGTPTYVRVLASLVTGVGLRFNNPYRLSRVLGETAESLSLTAPYIGLGLGAGFGDPQGWQWGPCLRWDRSLSGVGQDVVTPSVWLLRRFTWWAVHERLGVPILLSPETNVGVELGTGVTYHVRAGLGITSELIVGVYRGAAIVGRDGPAYPVVSGQLGVQVEWERLP